MDIEISLQHNILQNLDYTVHRLHRKISKLRLLVLTKDVINARVLIRLMELYLIKYAIVVFSM